MLGGNLKDQELLKWMRIVTITFTLLVTLYAVNSKLSIFKMVENAYQITLVMAFIPLVCGVYWKRATNQGAMLSILMGLFTWLGMLVFTEDPLVPPQFAGLMASATGMIVGSLMPNFSYKAVKWLHQ
jgi:Na+/proline symporter